MKRDLRDPTALGNLLLAMRDQDPNKSLVDLLQAYHLLAPDYQDETTIEKYGRPQDLPSTLPN